MVQGTPVTFLCDSGACKTTIREAVPHVVLSSNFTLVRAAQGVLKEVKETEPVWIKDPEGKSCQLIVLMLPECPVNLLGRDGLVALGLAIVPTADGLKVVRQRPEQVYVVQGVGKPNYYYTLDVPNKPPVSAGAALMDEGRQAVRHVQEQMSLDELHVTMWYSRNPEPKYKEKLDKVTPTKITVSYVYSDNEANSVAAVLLPDSLKSLHKVYTIPHISLCKGRNKRWQDLGKMIENGEHAKDWEATGVYTEYSDNTGLSRTALFWPVTVNSGVHLDKTQQ